MKHEQRIDYRFEMGDSIPCATGFSDGIFHIHESAAGSPFKHLATNREPGTQYGFHIEMSTEAAIHFCNYLHVQIGDSLRKLADRVLAARLAVELDHVFKGTTDQDAEPVPQEATA